MNGNGTDNERTWYGNGTAMVRRRYGSFLTEDWIRFSIYFNVKLTAMDEHRGSILDPGFLMLDEMNCE